MKPKVWLEYGEYKGRVILLMCSDWNSIRETFYDNDRKMVTFEDREEAYEWAQEHHHRLSETLE